MNSPAIETSKVLYRRMTEEDLAHALGLSQTMHWPHRLEDWQFVNHLGTGFVAEHNGEVIGTGMGWKQGKEYGSLGMMIVSPEHQGRGIGRKLMTLVLEALGDRCILLKATPAGQPLYESLGFIPTGTIHQHQGMMLPMPATLLADSDIIRPINADDIATLVGLANLATGIERDDLLKQLMCVAEGAVLECNGEISGFSLIRRFGRGYVIGPVVAPDRERATGLINYWGHAYADSFVRIDVTSDSHLCESLAAMGLAQVDSVVSMARNGRPPHDPRIEQYAIVNQALG